MIKAGLIGLGNIAWKFDAKNPLAKFPLSQAGAILARKDVVLVAGSSPDYADMAGFSAWVKGVNTYKTLEEMLGTEELDLVGVCSPTQNHFQNVVQCLKAGVKMIWLEKPPTEKSRDLEVLQALAKECNATVCVNYFRRYLSVYKELRNIVMQQKYGLCHALLVFYSPGLMRNGVHLIDQLFFITGARSYKLLWAENATDAENPAFTLRLDTGQLVMVCGAGLAYHTNDITAVCEKAFLSVTRGGKTLKMAEKVDNNLFPGFYELAEEQSTNVLCADGQLGNFMSDSLDNLINSYRAGCDPESNLFTAKLTQDLVEDIFDMVRV